MVTGREITVELTANWGALGAILWHEHHEPAVRWARTLAAPLLTLLAVVTLVLKSLVAWRLRES